MSDIPEFDGGDEVVVGVHESGITLQEGLNTSTSRNYCANCRRNTHCYVKVDRTTKEAIVHNTCKNDDCECKCKTHYSCKQCGFLHPYGQECNRFDSKINTDKKSDKKFNEIMDDWKKLQDSKQQNLPQEVKS